MTAFTVIVVILLIVAGYVALTSRRTVPTGQIGLVYKRFGSLSSADRFPVRIHGGPGPQAATLKSDRKYIRPSLLYRIKYVPRTYVPPDTIGLVIAKAGAIPPIDSGLGRHVECDHFQDGHAFLAGGGQMGKQPTVLPGGAYYDINPLLFEVITTETLGDGEKYGLVRSDLAEVSIPEGATGVVIAKEGAPPSDDSTANAVGRPVPGHSSFQLPSVFLDNGGQRGAQSETLAHGGVYRINPWFARVVIIPTRDIALDWSPSGSKDPDRYDVALDQIEIDVEGYLLWTKMTQVIRIPAKAAPYLVRRFGEQGDMSGLGDVQGRAPVQRFVERELGRTVESYFQSCAAEHEVLQFLEGHDEVRLEVQTRVREALAEWGVLAGNTTLNAFKTNDSDLNRQRQERARERDRRKKLEYSKDNAVIEEEIESIRIDTGIKREQMKVAETAERVRLLGTEAVVAKEMLGEIKEIQGPTIVGDSGYANGATAMAIAQQVANHAVNAVQESERKRLDRAADQPDDEEQHR